MHVKVKRVDSGDGFIPLQFLPKDTKFPYRHLNAEKFYDEISHKTLLRFDQVSVFMDRRYDSEDDREPSGPYNIDELMVVDDECADPNEIFWIWEDGTLLPVGTEIRVWGKNAMVYNETIIRNAEVCGDHYSVALREGVSIRYQLNRLWGYVTRKVALCNRALTLEELHAVEENMRKSNERGFQTMVASCYAMVDGFFVRFLFNSYHTTEGITLSGSRSCPEGGSINPDTRCTIIALTGHEDEQIYLSCLAPMGGHEAFELVHQNIAQYMKDNK